MLELTGVKGNRIFIKAEDIKAIEEHDKEGYVLIFTSVKKFKVKEFAIDIASEIQEKLDAQPTLADLFGKRK